MSSLLLLPGDPGFQETLENPNLFDWRKLSEQKDSSTLVMRAETGLLELVTNDELMDYVYGGEYDEIQGNYDQTA